MQKLKIIVMLLFSALTLLPVFTSCTAETSLTKYEETREMMDTFVRVTVYTADKESADKGITAAFDRMQEVVDAASIYDENAEAYRLNRDGYIDNPSADLSELIRLSIEYNNMSNGYFDITVQPLLDLWSAGLWQETPEVQQEKVNEVLNLVGSDKIVVTDNRISLSVPGMEITFGAIAKGYAVDKALETLKSLGIDHALIVAGGDIGAIGTKPNNEPWNFSLVNPDNTDQSLATFQFPQNASISTSGNYERYFSPDKKVAHLMNPKTGFTAGDSISVTIIAPSNTQADALATSVFVMGPEAGMSLVKSLKDVECFIVDPNRTIITSPGIDKYLVKS
jgi:thiamine biosynthesis lipoprotein